MQLLDHLWAVVVGFWTFSSPQDDAIGQIPLHRYLPEVGSSMVRPPKAGSGPVFRLPGSNIVCDYTAMEGWEACSTPTDRKCWLRHPATGQQFDIFSDYEAVAPIGITRFYEFDIRDSFYDADGINFTQAKLFDNRYPGPWVEACWGDTVVVNITNNLQTNGTSVHWQGIRQNQTNEMDGVNGVTQCPIAPGDSFVYKWKAIQYGSSWYHSHYSVQYADGAAGPLTLYGPTSTSYDETLPPLILSDWGHDSAFTAVTRTFPNQLDKADILLNGLGNITKYNNSIPSETTVQPPYTVHFQKPHPGASNRKYLMRIINTSFQTTFVFSIDNHLLQIVSTDFVPVSPYYNTSILIGIGQRYDVIVEANPLLDSANRDAGPIPSDGNFWIRTFVVGDFCYADRNPGSLHYEETGILRYDTTSTAEPTSQQWSNISLACSDETYSSLHPMVPWTIGLPKNNNVESGGFNVSQSGATRTPTYPLAFWTLGDSVSPSIRVDYDNITFLNLDNQGGWNQSFRVVSEPFDPNTTEWVWLVIQSPTGANGSHPIHLHGHDFALVAVGNGVFDPTMPLCTGNMQCNNPPRRDVALLPAAGYIVIAFKADNPGAWLVHCHIAFHISGGLGLQILEDQEAARQLWPTGHSPALT